MAKSFNILNSKQFNILQKIALGEKIQLFLFGGTSNWKHDYESLRARYYILSNELLSLKEKNE